jgi:hypothetical protein
MADLIIGDDTWIAPSNMDGTFARGLVQRDLKAFPMGAFAPVANIPLVDMKDLPDRIREQEEKQTSLRHMILRGNYGQPIPSLDQNDPKYFNSRNPRWGYCWAHGPVGATEALRARFGEPFVRLSAFGLAYTIKNGEDLGGWAALAMDKLIRDGVGPEELWPRFEQKMRHPGDLFWVKAQEYKVTDGWVELESPVYDRDLSWHQILSLLINRVPVCKDHNWWGHSVYGCAVWDAYPNKDPKDPSRYGTWDRNSWGDQYGDRGFYKLKDTKARPDNAVAPSAVMAA